METSNNTGKLITALVTGVVIGGAAGTLFAPEKGNKIRQTIACKWSNFIAFIKEKLNMENVKNLNSKILKITMRITEEYPELYKYIEEMQETIPDESSPEINLKKLKMYYESLNSMIGRYA